MGVEDDIHVQRVLKSLSISLLCCSKLTTHVLIHILQIEYIDEQKVSVK